MTRGNPRITLRLEQSAIDQLKKIAETQKKTVSDVIRDALETYMTEVKTK